MIKLSDVRGKSERSAAEILTEMSDFLIGTVDVNEAMQFALTRLIDYLGGSLCMEFTTLENDGQDLLMRAQRYSALYSALFGKVGDLYSLTDLPGSRQVIENGRFFHLPDLASQVFAEKQTADAIADGMQSILYVPLLARSKPIGVLHVESWQTPREFSPEEIQLCQGVANLVAAAIENGRLLAAERNQLLLAQTLQKVGSLLTSQLSLSELYDQLFHLLAEVVAYDSVSIQLFDRKTNRAHLVASKGFDFSSMDEKLLNDIAQHSLQKFNSEQYVCIISDTNASELWVIESVTEKVRSWIGALLRVNGEIIGILNVDSLEVNAFQQKDGDLVAAFANQAAIAIENTRLYKETDRRATELSILHQLAMDTTSVENLDELFTKVTTVIVSTLYPESFGIALVDEARRNVILHHSCYGISTSMKNRIIPLQESICGQVVETGQPVIVPDVRESARYVAINAEMLSEVAIPIKIHDEVIGIINVESCQVNAFANNDIVFLTTLAGLISVRVARMFLYQQLQTHLGNLEKEVAVQTAELKLERDRTITILEHAGESILLLDSTAKIVYVNRAMTIQSGYTSEQLVGQTPMLLESGLTAKQAYSELWNRLVRGQSWTGQLINKRQDGSFYDVAMTMAPITTIEGEVTGFVIVEADITRLKEIERLKTEFVANVTHELRTPLTNIKTYVALAERGREEKRERYFQILNHETDRLAQLIQDLLDLSHLETEAPLKNVPPVDLGLIVREYVDIFQAKAALKNIQLEHRVSGGETAVSIEDKHIGQLLTNLLGNAIAYTPDDGQIVVKVGRLETAVPSQIWFQITDSGTGIPPEELPHLFDRFYRGAYGQKEGVPGTGLGLAICQGIVNRYHGRIEIKSEVGRGTTVIVYLPKAVIPVEPDIL